MLENFYDYIFFVAKAFTIVIAILILFAGIASAASKAKKEQSKGSIKVSKLNEKLKSMEWALKESILSKNQLKLAQKEEKSLEKKQEKQEKPRVYVLDFNGDIKASAVSSLREAITAVLAVATKADEIVVRLESGGGMVHSYGLAAAQLRRIKDKAISLTISIDKVAASGGYMMACIGDKLIASPFAMVGSIGVVAQLPNFNRLLKKHDIDYEMLTAGEYKRTLTMFGENTDKARDKFKEDIEDTHLLFKEFVAQNRSSLDIEKVATGEVWFGRRALERQLVDALQTSDEYLVEKAKTADVYEVEFFEKKSLQQKLSFMGAEIIDRTILRLIKRLQQMKLFS